MTVAVQSFVRFQQALLHRGASRPVLLDHVVMTPYCRYVSSSVEQMPHDTSRSKFKDAPVDSSIFKYIQSIGVGIPKRKITNRRNKKRRNNTSKSQFLSRKEEQEELRPIRRLASKTPPPPFVPAQSRKNDNHKTEEDNGIRRLPVKLIGSAATQDEFPRGSKGLAEVAIAGRSNVGKSTLLNALLYGNYYSQQDQQQQQDDDDDKQKQQLFRKQRRPTARTAKLPKGLKAITSSKPGETRSLNFYQLSAFVTETTQKISLLLVDLPGYGFAYATPDKMEGWKKTMQDYVLHRGKPLKRILFLIDARHGMKQADFEFMESLQIALLQGGGDTETATKKKRELPPIQLVLTKCDLVLQSDLARRVAQVRQQLSDSLIRQPSALPVMLVSAQMEGQAGVLELQKELAALVVMPSTKTIS